MKIYTIIEQNRNLFWKKDRNIQDLILTDNPIRKLSEEEQFLSSSNLF